MRKHDKKPLTLTTATVKKLDREALDRIAAGISGHTYTGSETPACYASGLSLCPYC